MNAKLFITDRKGTLTEKNVSAFADDGVENEVLNIYENVQYQTMEGFGGALTDSAGYVFSRMNGKQQEELLTMYFDESHMGYNQVRIPVDSCDFSTHLYEAAPDREDENLEGFSFADTEKYILPLLERAQKKAGKKLKIMLSAWSPPAYMKTNGSRTGGGSLKKEYRRRWAAYLCRYVEEYRKRGYEVVRMTIQNEPNAVQKWDSCLFTAQEEKEFLRDYLVPALRERGMEDIELFIWDHNKERVYERARDTIDDTTEDMISGIAFHWYSGDHFEALDMVRQRFPEKKLILSESCLEFGRHDREAQLENAGKLAHDMIGNLNHGMSGFYDWNILLDENGGPNHVDNFCDAPFLYHLEEGRLEERMCLKYYWHFAHFIRPGAVRLAVTRYTDALDFTAWRNADGRLVFVILNRSENARPCYLRVRGQVLEIEAEAQSIISGEI
ncbi:O-Glycosyl hydrolase family 30 [Marvinbryantia formatexigens DSM 14469]|uniref:O-Glycosyl hydrolase family 30 n=1 Tax=Marvinbryantia formatexigens DSM 14469 TaxID=478749 RepID=C6LMK7_9FIRM|nr:glycoside hydrolase family 30 beta sandwich domain-containing protein [Marvinbryantia formatexigens]EET58136.1 O-Glycosyl hydrolase family 30 [Marvinbryantia formatexigens DSM 14469]UWO23930.1 glucosylceramidase [Marvinbryantia formatexigens DSM 14469]SDH11409.1 glucosylceramidase [Marvinbryantia formatexigens]